MSPGLPNLYVEQNWYAAYTRPRHEKRVAEQLDRRFVESFLPLYETVRRWKNGRTLVQFPLFPGYVFTRIALKDRLHVLEIPGVVRLVGFNGIPSPLPEEQIDGLRKGFSGSGTLRAEPHPYLTAGLRVRIRSGPLAGLEGIVQRTRSNLRVILSVDMIQRSLAVEVDASEIVPVL